jgi:outer membrane protein TolC
MKTQKYKNLFAGFLFLLTTTILPGQQFPDSLVTYLELAAKNNPAVLQKFNEYKAALQKVPQVGGLSDPELSIGYFLKPMELVNGNQVADLRLMQMFPWFGVLRSAKDEMSLMANAKFELFRDARLQVSYDVQRTWYELFKIRKEIEVSQKNLEILGTIERLSIAKFQSGSTGGGETSKAAVNDRSQVNSGSGRSSMQPMGGSAGPPTVSDEMQQKQVMQAGSMGSSSGMSGLVDIYRIQIEKGELQNNISMLRNQHNTVLAQFNGYLNRPPETPVFVPDSFRPDTLSMPLISVPDSIQANNPMLTMLELEKQSLDARKKMVKSMSYPMVGLGLNYSVIGKSGTSMGAPDMNGKDMIMPMISVTLPIYRKKYNAMISETELLRKAATNNYYSTASSLQTDYFQALQLYQDAGRRVKLYLNQSLLASKSLDLMIKGFSSSSSSLSDLLRVSQQSLDYDLKQAEAIAELNTATALMRRLMASSQIN